MDLALYFAVFAKIIFYALLTAFFLNGSLTVAQTKLDPKAEAKKAKSKDGKATIYEISYPTTNSEASQISTLRIRVENGKATAFDLEWTKAHDPKKLKAQVMTRKVTENFRTFSVAVRETGRLSSFISPPARYYQISTSDDYLSKLPMKISSAEKEVLKKEWDIYFFGFEEGNANQFTTDGKPKTLKATEAISEINDDGTYSAHNSQAMKAIQDQATAIARAIEANGKDTGKNEMIFNGFPSKNIPVQAFPLPDSIKEGVEDAANKLGSTPGRFVTKDNRTPKQK